MRESDRANTRSQRRTSKQRATAASIPRSPLHHYTPRVNHRDMNHYPLLHLARPRDNEHRIVSAIYILKYDGISKKETTHLRQDVPFVSSIFRSSFRRDPLYAA